MMELFFIELLRDLWLKLVIQMEMELGDQAKILRLSFLTMNINMVQLEWLDL